MFSWKRAGVQAANLNAASSTAAGMYLVYLSSLDDNSCLLSSQCFANFLLIWQHSARPRYILWLGEHFYSTAGNGAILNTTFDAQSTNIFGSRPQNRKKMQQILHSNVVQVAHFLQLHLIHEIRKISHVKPRCLCYDTLYKLAVS